MSGLPASGKSTKAKELIETRGNTVRINKDLLRTMLHFDKFNGVNEALTQEASTQLASYFLDKNVNVIIDDTNLNPKVMNYWKEFGKTKGFKVEYCDLDTPVEECLIRNIYREKKVPSDVIVRMALQYKELGKGKKAIICDVDGTIADITHLLS